MELTTETVQALIRLSRVEAPAEACGTLAWIDTQWILRASINLARNHEEAFCIDAVCSSLFFNDWQREYPVMIWHSHPRSRAVPTPADLALMKATRVPMVIVSLLPTVPEVSVFVLDAHNPDRARQIASYRLPN